MRFRFDAKCGSFSCADSSAPSGSRVRCAHALLPGFDQRPTRFHESHPDRRYLSIFDYDICNSWVSDRTVEKGYPKKVWSRGERESHYIIGSRFELVEQELSLAVIRFELTDFPAEAAVVLGIKVDIAGSGFGRRRIYIRG